jgi:5'-nucleotidase / UDP-sugar diphosphatase
MKNIRVFFFIIVLATAFSACCKDEVEDLATLGEIKANLNASKSEVRKKETLIGNFIADAIKSEAESKGIAVDFAMENGGGIRFNEEIRPSGIYPAGLFTTEMIDEMLPFGNTSAIVTVTGKELKEIFERSVAQLPLAQGPFLQVSKELKIVIDTTQSPQVINELVEPNVIVNEGNRIVSIKINDVEYDSLATYKLITSDFIAAGNDGYVTFKNIGNDKKVQLGENQTGAVKEYLILHSPLLPIIEGRIVYQ